MVNKPYDLVILAAGIGSRFGGVKQVQPVGPSGELIIEYSAFDALRAGFGRLVLVIRKEIEADFRAAIGRRLEARIDVQYVFQESAGRAKPWGTGHAVLAAKAVVDRPFAVQNADDFYGAAGYAALAGHFGVSRDYALVGYPLRQTLSEHGAVSRGVCRFAEDGRLAGITELTRIEATTHGAKQTESDGLVRLLSGDEVVSMNNWGFTPDVFPRLERLFAEFVAARGMDPKAEFYLPAAVSSLIERKEARVAVLASTDAWFGLTYKEDVPAARSALAALIAAGKYPSPLWG